MRHSLAFLPEVESDTLTGFYWYEDKSPGLGSGFLPRPSDLVFREENVKVTLELSKTSVSLFKSYANKKGLKYQRMIRTLVDNYAEKTLR